ncbi:hypothetical protein [Azospirillum rugosum]|uniref:Uncharacterized protein n=1 Tax=Azospirillum rugosum TaxID=416170 RepID=A0ABS4SU34_9PROT|nr:hypothetical protein [Azospirillum rugosum]MBP2295477.1 hypothetical protein [Azospirillum rugosum]MDQ0528356.1 hypothetical protein [Azospirillum rugosum]
MASRRRKAPRKAKKGLGPGSVPEMVGASGPSPGRAGTPFASPFSAKSSSSVLKRRKPRYSAKLDADAGKFLSPEQQYLLRKRRDVEQREAKQRRSAVGLFLVAVAVAAGGAAWAFGWV